MIRIAIFLAAVAVLAIGAAWLADRPGEIAVVWQGWRVSTSVTVAAVALLVAFVVTHWAWSLVGLVLRTPTRVADYVEERRQLRGWRAVSRGLIAIGTGNARLAHRSAAEAKRMLGAEPLTHLLAAQSAQLAGDSAEAESEFRAMLEHEETKLLGLRGLYVEARRRADAPAALAFAEEAARTDAALPWASEALSEFRCRAGDWAGALELLDRQIAAKAISKAAGKRKRGVLLAGQALALEDSQPARARELANEAVKLVPDLVPAIAVAARLEGSAGNLRRGARLVEKAWTAAPHPELAETYTDLRPGDTARERLKRVRSLAARTPGHAEASLAVARAAIDAHEFGQARDALAPLTSDPTQRVCLLMAELEASEYGDHGKAREWTMRAMRARRDPTWVADGYVSERWLPASPISGRIDAFAWAVPPAAIAGPLLDQTVERALTTPPAAAKPPAPRAETTVPAAAKAKPKRAPVRPAPDFEPVVAEPPLPDDPGPEPAPSGSKRFRLFNWLSSP